MDDKVTITQLLKKKGKELGVSGLSIPYFLRVQVGEGLEQAQSADFAAEVAAMAK